LGYDASQRRSQLSADPLYGVCEAPVKGERNKLYDSAAAFFDLEGSISMKLTPEAALQVCSAAGSRGQAIARVEGGIWHDPGFEARIDCIWDASGPPFPRASAESNNEAAAAFIREQSPDHTAFVITTMPVEAASQHAV
jgi:hypothetical protein